MKHFLTLLLIGMLSAGGLSVRADRGNDEPVIDAPLLSTRTMNHFSYSNIYRTHEPNRPKYRYRHRQIESKQDRAESQTDKTQPESP